MRIFVMGTDEWRDEDDWPLPDTEFTRYFLHSDGRANTATGDGRLSTAAPGDEPRTSTSTTRATRCPPSAGRRCCRGTANAGPGRPAADRGAGRRAVLHHPGAHRDGRGHRPRRRSSCTVVIGGRHRLHRQAGRRHPDGRAEDLTDGILRARYRDSLGDRSRSSPGEIYELPIDLLATSNVFRAGHRIRLEVSSSNFPRFDRNTNTGGAIAEDGDADAQVAVNRVFHGPAHPPARAARHRPLARRARSWSTPASWSRR